MDAKVSFTVSNGLVVTFRRALLSFGIAALLALGAVIAQNELSRLTGVGSVLVAQACQSSSGGGVCKGS